MAEADTGDPRFANPIWQGRYEASPAEGVTMRSPAIMLSNDNTVQFCGDAMGVKANDPAFTVPEECRPASEIAVPVAVESTRSYAVTAELDESGEVVSAYGGQIYNELSVSVVAMTVSPDGSVTFPVSGDARLNGICYHVNDRYYA